MSGPFPPGAPVRLKAIHPPGHVRTPFYLRGKRGTIERDLGMSHDPEALAYGWAKVPPRRLYRVRFTMAEVWGAAAERPEDRLDAEIFEHWLEADDAAR